MQQGEFAACVSANSYGPRCGAVRSCNRAQQCHFSGHRSTQNSSTLPQQPSVRQPIRTHTNARTHAHMPEHAHTHARTESTHARTHARTNERTNAEHTHRVHPRVHTQTKLVRTSAHMHTCTHARKDAHATMPPLTHARTKIRVRCRLVNPHGADGGVIVAQR